MRRAVKGLIERSPAKAVLQIKRACYALGFFSVSLALAATLAAQSQDCSNYPETPASSTLSSDPNQLSVLLYNTQLRPRLLFSSGQSDRTSKIVPLLSGYDIVVLSEVFDDQALRELSRLHSYQAMSLPLGQNEGLSQDSGLVIFSQWPMPQVTQRRRLFEGDCDGNSCFNHQGVLAVALKKDEDGPTYHIVAAQIQSGDSQKAIDIRDSQYQQLRQFIDDLNISPNEPVIFATSLPISSQTHPTEFAQMQAQLGLKVIDAEGSSASSPPTLKQVSEQTSETLFTLSQNALFQSVDARIRPMRTSAQRGWKSADWFYWQCPQQDLSDHHAIEGILHIKLKQ